MIRQLNNRRGLSLLETMIAFAILALVSAIVIPGMVYFAHSAKGMSAQQRIQQRANIFSQRLDMALAQSDTVNLVNSTTIRIQAIDSEYVPDEDSPTGFRFAINNVTRRIEFRDLDENTDTIGDNSLVMITTTRSPAGTVVSTVEEEVLTMVSPLVDDDGKDLPIFAYRTREQTGAARPYIDVRFQVGDRSNPSNSSYDALTGFGYQGMTFRTVLSPNNIPLSQDALSDA